MRLHVLGHEIQTPCKHGFPSTVLFAGLDSDTGEWFLQSLGKRLRRTMSAGVVRGPNDRKRQSQHGDKVGWAPMSRQCFCMIRKGFATTGAQFAGLVNKMLLARKFPE